MESILTTLKMVRKNTEKIIAAIILKSSSHKQAAGCAGVCSGCFLFFHKLFEFCSTEAMKGLWFSEFSAVA